MSAADRKRIRGRAAILEKVNSPLRVAEIEMPARLDFGQVLVRVLASGICGAQLQEIRGEKGNTEHMPHLLGHEGCGIVEACHESVTRVKPGDKVVMHWRKAAGIEADCPFYAIRDRRMPWTNRPIGGGRVTTLAEYSVVSENRLTPVPADTPKELAALLGCGLSTALGTFENEAQVRFGESVLIVGLGGLGVNLVRCACMAHCHPIVAVDVHEGKRKLAREMGADRYVNAAKEWVAAAGKFDLIIDTAGAGKSMEDTLPLLKPSGRFVMVGQPKPGATVPLMNARHLFDGEGKTIKATQGGGFVPDRDIPRYVALHKAGKLSIAGIVTHRLPLSQINRGIALVRKGRASRVMIDMELC